MSRKPSHYSNAEPPNIENPGNVNSQMRGELTKVKLIGQGGMSNVFRAYQPALDRYVVIKKLKQELASNPETAERFRREAKSLASVLHQNIAHVYDFVERPGEFFILMEFIDGVDLSVVLKKVGSIPSQLACSVLLGVAKGLSYIHARGLIHRDIKPANIRLSTRGEVKLMDFGIVLELDNTALTRPGMMVGSPSYLAPEQVIGDSVTNRADIFLMGICLYEMLTGTRPFRADERTSVFQRIREAKYIPARKMNQSIPVEVDAIVRKCLAQQPEKRYQTVDALIEDLERCLGPLGANRTEKYILRFLDEEALVQPALQVDARGHAIKKKSRLSLVLRLLATIALIGAAFGAGYYYADSKIDVLSKWAEPKPYRKQ